MAGSVKIKTQDLSGVALDWAVAKAEGLDFEPYFARYRKCWEMHVVRCGYNPERKVYVFEPSADWGQGGRLIEKYRIGFGIYESSLLAVTGHNDFAGSEHGETHLIAACRAIVAARLGDDVDVPEVLA